MINLQSLSVKTLVKMSIRITIIVVIVTAASYVHLMHTIEFQTKDTLAKYIKERQARERITFDEAHENHEKMRENFLALYKRYLKNPQSPQLFDKLVKQYPDLTHRNADEKFDGKKTPGVFIGPKSPIDLKLKARVLAAYDIISQFGPAYSSRFQDSYFVFPENAVVLFWPQEPRWVINAQSDLNMPDEEYVSVSLPQNDPSRKTAWTGLYYDKVSSIWMVTGSTPIYDGDDFLGSVNHDVMVTELVNRTINDHIKGASNYIFRADGRLIAHSRHLEDIKNQGGQYDIKSSSDANLKDQFTTITNSSLEEVLSDNYDNYLAVAKIQGPDWLIVSEYPKNQIRTLALANIGFLLGGALLSLILELVVLFFVLRREITIPLLSLVNGTKTIAEGNYFLRFEAFEKRRDELGLLATSFADMAAAINDKDKKLARHNEDLESLVEERTKELDEQKTLNVQASKLSSLGEMAGGIAHEINTPLATIKLLAAQAQDEVNDAVPNLTTVNEHLEKIDKTVDRVAKIVRGLKSFARDGSNDPIESLDFGSVLDDTIALCKERFKQYGVELRVGKITESLTIEGRSVELGQVLLNLINNAYDAIEKTPEKWIEIKIDNKIDSLEIRISDSGPGIPEALRDKIFNPFFTTKDVGKGTGIGLSISHGIIKGHHGKLFYDESSHNTCFVIELPKKAHSVAV